MKRTLLRVIFFLCLSTLYGQKNFEPTLEEIQLAKEYRTKYSKDDIAILESNETITFKINKTNELVETFSSKKQKLMNINHASQTSLVEFYDSQSRIDKFLIKYKNNKIFDSALYDQFFKDQNLFYNDAKVKYHNLSFPTQGYTFLTEVERTCYDLKYFTLEYFPEIFPVIKKTYTVIVPDWLDLEIKEFNFNGQLIQKSKTYDQEKKQTVYTYSVENLYAFDKEQNSPGKSHVYPHILFLPKSFKDSKGTEHTLFKTTAHLYTWYKSLINSMQDNPKVFEEKVKEIVKNATTDEEKIKAVYYWVQDNIRYIAFEDGIAGFKPDESNHVFEKRYGDCKGMANLLKHMLKQLGFDARLTWIGTKQIVYDYSMPNLAVDNHMICTVFHNGTKIYLDGTEKFNSIGKYAERIQGRPVLIENGEEFILDKIPTTASEQNKEIRTFKFDILDEKLIGKAHLSYFGESASNFYHTYNSLESANKNEKLKSFLADNNKNFAIDNVQTSNLNDRDLQIKIDYDMQINNKITSFDNQIYIDLEIGNEYKNLNFKDRRVDFELPYKTNFETITSLNIPKGYQIVKTPADINIKSNDFEVQITYKNSGNELVYNKKFIFNNAIITTTDFEKWNDFSKKLNENYQQQIVLQKI